MRAPPTPTPLRRRAPTVCPARGPAVLETAVGQDDPGPAVTGLTVQWGRQTIPDSDSSQWAGLGSGSPGRGQLRGDLQGEVR